MAIIQTSKGWDVQYLTWQDIKLGWCPFCQPENSEVKTTGHYTAYCRNCDNTFVYTGR